VTGTEQWQFGDDVILSCIASTAVVSKTVFGMYRRKPNEGLDDAAKCPSSPTLRSFVKPQGKAAIWSKKTAFSLTRIDVLIESQKLRVLVLSFAATLLLIWKLNVAATGHSQADSPIADHRMITSRPDTSKKLSARTAPRTDPLTIEVRFPWQKRRYAWPALPRLRNTRDKEKKADYGTLGLTFLEKTKFRRRIGKHDLKELHRERKEHMEAMDTDDESSESTYLPDDELPYPVECERVAWKSAPKPICNTVHELTRNPNRDKYLGYVFVCVCAWCRAFVFTSQWLSSLLTVKDTVTTETLGSCPIQ
jgi:hypothetical protein